VRRVDPESGKVLERLEMPLGVGVTGLEADGGDQFFCGGGSSGRVLVIRRPRRGSAVGKSSKTLIDAKPKSSKRPSRAASR
jgi:hypothetical protein